MHMCVQGAGTSMHLAKDSPHNWQFLRFRYARTVKMILTKRNVCDRGKANCGEWVCMYGRLGQSFWQSSPRIPWDLVLVGNCFMTLMIFSLIAPISLGLFITGRFGRCWGEYSWILLRKATADFDERVYVWVFFYCGMQQVVHTPAHTG